MAWKVETVTLAYPIPVGELSLTEISFREPNAEILEMIEDMGFAVEGAPNPKIGQMITLLAAMSGKEESVLRQLHRKDFEQICERVAPLLDPSGQDGDSPNPTATE